MQIFFFPAGENNTTESPWTKKAEKGMGETGRERITVQIKVNHISYRFSSNPTLILGKALWEIPDVWMPFWKVMVKRQRDPTPLQTIPGFSSRKQLWHWFSHPGTNTFYYVDSIVRVLSNPQNISVGNVTSVVTRRLQRVKRMLR